MGYDENKKGWQFDPNTSRCHVSHNVIFDETSSWWTSKYVALSQSKEIEERQQESFEEPLEELQQSTAATPQLILQKKPWQTGVY